MFVADSFKCKIIPFALSSDRMDENVPADWSRIGTTLDAT